MVQNKMYDSKPYKKQENHPQCKQNIFYNQYHATSPITCSSSQDTLCYEESDNKN